MHGLDLIFSKEIARNYEKAIIDLDAKLKSVQEKAEMRSNEKLEKLNVQADKKVKEQGIGIQELEKSWKDYFWINADQKGKKISVFTENKR